MSDNTPDSPGSDAGETATNRVRKPRASKADAPAPAGNESTSAPAQPQAAAPAPAAPPAPAAQGGEGPQLHEGSGQQGNQQNQPQGSQEQRDGARGNNRRDRFRNRRDRQRGGSGGGGDRFRDDGLPWLFLLGFLLMGVFVSLYNYISYRLLAAPFHLGHSAVGAMSLLYTIGIASSVWAGRMADRFGRRTVRWLVMALMWQSRHQ